ncbi:hypothetical protein STFE110948_04360 [Streptobacillus felis]|uniref:hypothetical protein n=1 Tax=Streptobacillus felis TaxID=1384509 RepID=UPI0008349174|nr:hypothetical protein [Streptobacillus felis]
MKKIIISILTLLTINSFSMISKDEGYSELKGIKKELVTRYKKEMNIDFSDLSKNTVNEQRIFNETLYLKFLSKYVFDITDVKMYSSPSVNNIVIFADKPIDKNDFKSLYAIIAKEENSKKLKLLQVPSANSKNDLDKIIQERSSERD